MCPTTLHIHHRVDTNFFFSGAADNARSCSWCRATQLGGNNNRLAVWQSLDQQPMSATISVSVYVSVCVSVSLTVVLTLFCRGESL